MDMQEDFLTLYVYYKIPAQQQANFLLAVKNLNQAIKKIYPLLKTMHQKRIDVDKEDRELWMEIYQGIPHEKFKLFTNDLTVFAEKYGLPKERKCEIFISL